MVHRQWSLECVRMISLSNTSSRPLTSPLTSFYADIEEGGGVFNRGGKSKRLAIGWDSMDMKRPRRGR